MQLPPRDGGSAGTSMSGIPGRTAPIGESRDRELLKDASTYIYEQRPEGPLLAHVFSPPGPPKAPRPVVIFHHGGLWDHPAPVQFVPHCLHFANRGTVAIVAETRCSARHGTTACDAIDDARDLVRWVRRHADTLGINPLRLAVGGAGGGATLALLTALQRPPKEPVPGVPSFAPQAVVLFSGVYDTTAKSVAARFPDPASARRHNPLRLVRRRLPPILMFHGKADRIAPFADAERFRRKARFWRNDCRLVDFEKADHGFFNFNFSHLHFELTIEAADRFLVETGLLGPSDDSGVCSEKP
jgi:acetyl esterase